MVLRVVSERQAKRDGTRNLEAQMVARQHAVLEHHALLPATPDPIRLCDPASGRPLMHISDTHLQVYRRCRVDTIPSHDHSPLYESSPSSS
jgi:hypothetical protein